MTAHGGVVDDEEADWDFEIFQQVRQAPVNSVELCCLLFVTLSVN